MYLVLFLQVNIKNFNDVIHYSPSHTFYHIWTQRFYSEVFTCQWYPSLSESKKCFSPSICAGAESLRPSLSLSHKTAITSNWSQSSSYLTPIHHLLFCHHSFPSKKIVFDEVTSLIKDPWQLPLLKIEIGMGSASQQSWPGIQVPSTFIFMELWATFLTSESHISLICSLEIYYYLSHSVVIRLRCKSVGEASGMTPAIVDIQ